VLVPGHNFVSIIDSGPSCRAEDQVKLLSKVHSKGKLIVCAGAKDGKVGQRIALSEVEQDIGLNVAHGDESQIAMHSNTISGRVNLDITRGVVKGGEDLSIPSKSFRLGLKSVIDIDLWP
jgi:hypothetical protein